MKPKILSFCIVIFFVLPLITFAGNKLEVLPSPQERLFNPLDTIIIRGVKNGLIEVLDGKGHIYLKLKAQEEISFQVGGSLGFQQIIWKDDKGREIDKVIYQVSCKTGINDDSGKYGQLLDILYNSMTGELEREAEVYKYNNKYYHAFVSWLRDHVHTLKGMKYFYPELKSAIDLYGDSQREDGMIWDNYNKHPEEGDYWEQRFDYGGFVRVVDNGYGEFRRIPVENDVEYLFIEGIYYTWKATGDNKWMESMLDKALKAVNYSFTDEYRWSEKYRLLKRGYTIDTWDFQNDEDASISTGEGFLPDAMVVRPEYTRFGVMFGDNTGMAAGLKYLAEMLRYSGRNEEAERINQMGIQLKQRLDELSWNGEFYTHHVPEQENLKRDLGVDESLQVSLSNAYSLNRDLTHEQCVAIIKTYQRLRSEMPQSSPGEWYTIFPPFEKGYGDHNTKWSYMNGGVTPIVAGELAHGAFEHGFEDYGVDILDRIYSLSKKMDDYLYCVYRGAMPENPIREFVPLDLKEIANTDFCGNTIEGVHGWTNEGENDLHEFPTGRQVFHDIPFEIIDPEKNGRRACIGLSGLDGYPGKVSLQIGKKARSIYLLHTTGQSYYAGCVRLKYEDGTVFRDHIATGKISNWWYPSESQDRKQVPVFRVAWRGKNKFSRNVGVGVYGLNNPYPDKIISEIIFEGSQTKNKWIVLGVTLSDYEVFFTPDIVSTGIPDNWGAAAVVYALVEGLAGVKDAGVAFDKAILAPRWEAAGVKKVSATIKYEASGGYLSYSYQKLTDNKVEILFTGTADSTLVKLLLPEGRAVSHVFLNNKEVTYETEKIEESEYMILNITGRNVKKLIIDLI
jgi:hypothetical protein